MNSIKACIAVGAIISGMMTQANDYSNVSWLMFANSCDQYTVAQYKKLTLDDFLVTDDAGNSIYDIALSKHKQTGSIPCARMAMFLMKQEQELRKIFQQDIADKLGGLDEVEKKFETPH